MNYEERCCARGQSRQKCAKVVLPVRVPKLDEVRSARADGDLLRAPETSQPLTWKPEMIIPAPAFEPPQTNRRVEALGRTGLAGPNATTGSF